MTLDEWRHEETLVAWAATVFDTPEGNAFLEMIETENPKNYQKPDFQPGQTPMELGKIYGYDNCVNNIIQSRNLLVDVAMPTPTFEPPEPPEPEKE